ncbi:hypothetical protein [Nocardia flavorosea]|uniref:Excreted virulence factor EspC (Type VII ESX diderm) n=1 Tax=Nocardia flavorosea TaxID=53429 RepID=A0A846YU43_9NOCA|nr:hypothetical protein [Nocardia flavorosea]NKY61048.1 hypothetical protein [Nocardia flavorosea]
MTGPLQVDIDVLTKTVTGLRNSQQMLEDALKAMADVGAASIGTQALDDAADSFQRRWHFGVQRIGELSRTTADGVDQCLAAYQAVDNATATALGQVNSAPPTTGEQGQP